MTAEPPSGLSPDDERRVRLRADVERIRTESAAGRLVAGSDLEIGQAGEDTGRATTRHVPPPLFAELGAEAADIEHVTSAGAALYYSTRSMTGRYAELKARAGRGDLAAAVAETVRDESATYPRPTPVAAFLEPPFNISPDALDGLVARVLADPASNDICLVEASDGSRFLFSTRHLDARHAASLAEWVAVGRGENP